MIPHMGLKSRLIAWLLWKVNGWSDPDECRFECLERPCDTRMAALCVDYWYVRKSREQR